MGAGSHHLSNSFRLAKDLGVKALKSGKVTDW